MRAGAAIVLLLATAGAPGSAVARSSGDPVRLVWSEGDVAGTTTVYDGADDAQPHTAIGFVEYHQQREGDLLKARRVARFRDGSSDEDLAVARVGATLTALSGRSIIRDPDGEPIVDLRIDVAGGKLDASWGRGADRQTLHEDVALPPGTYWGPLVFLVLKNFEANADDGRVVFRTVAPSPRPIVIDMEIVRGDAHPLERTGIRLTAGEFVLRPTIHWMVDPVVHWLAPTARFWVLPGEPPALLRFKGPRNYTRKPIVIE